MRTSVEVMGKMETGWEGDWCGSDGYDGDGVG